jgi:hypothetical protein
LGVMQELVVQLDRAESSASRQHHESNNLFHRVIFFPGVPGICNPSPWIFCHLSLWFVPNQDTSLTEKPLPPNVSMSMTTAEIKLAKILSDQLEHLFVTFHSTEATTAFYVKS